MGRDVRVVLVGDEGVGKSTIICALIKESFVELPPRSYLPEVSIPPVTPEANVTTYVTDTSPRPEDRPHLENEIRKSHVVCIVYAIDNSASFERISAYWLPLIRSLGVNVCSLYMYHVFILFLPWFIKGACNSLRKQNGPSWRQDYQRGFRGRGPTNHLRI